MSDLKVRPPKDEEEEEREPQRLKPVSGAAFAARLKTSETGRPYPAVKRRDTRIASENPLLAALRGFSVPTRRQAHEA
jgi:hypothetical protein